MIIGIPAEVKNREYRVGMTPETAREMTLRGHRVVVQKDAGAGIGATNAHYRAAGARIASTAREVFAKAEMIVKVKEPVAAERKMLRRGQTLFTYLHLAADRALTAELVKSGATCIAYETVTGEREPLPLLAPMSKIAGRLAAQVAAEYLQKSHGGKGRLMGGVAGVSPAKVAVLGGGMVGRHAARIAAGMGAEVTILDISPGAMEAIDAEWRGQIQTLYASSANIEKACAAADVIIGGVLVPGAKAPKIVPEKVVRAMREGGVAVDVTIDQGGCLATSRPTTHDKPVYVKHGVVHYCVTNMPGAVPLTSTYALNNATLPYLLELAEHGWHNAARKNAHLAAGLSIAEGKLYCAATANSLGMKSHDRAALLRVH